MDTNKHEEDQTEATFRSTLSWQCASLATYPEVDTLPYPNSNPLMHEGAKMARDGFPY